MRPCLCHFLAFSARYLFVLMLIPTYLISDAAADSNSGLTRAVSGFQTKHGRFEPVQFEALPGWKDDKIGDAWGAFRQSCIALRKKAAWSSLCASAAGMSGQSDAALREFFEREFDLFQILNSDSSKPGVITGYYEPQLAGSHQFSAATPYPVYGAPEDMLFLDARRLAVPGSELIKMRLDGHNVVPASSQRSTGSIYLLDLKGVEPDSRTRKYRLRVDGQHLVPYLSRQEIERGPAPRAEIIAWVSSAAGLYSMQIQGSGKIRLPDGEIIRVGYAEQNGHPFRPSVLASAQYVNGGHATASTRTRGFHISQDVNDEEVALSKYEMLAPFFDLPTLNEDSATGEEVPLTRGIRHSPHSQHSTILPSDVDRMISMLMPTVQQQQIMADSPSSTNQTNSGPPTAIVSARPLAATRSEEAVAAPIANLTSGSSTMADTPPQRFDVSVGTLAVAPAEVVPVRPERSQITALALTAPSAPANRPLAVPRPLVNATGVANLPRKPFVNNDPSYVFFRVIPNSENGPIGALGVPLTAGRSLAVDPRTTPLGFPVFISTREPGQKQTLNRLMLAQDAGGAIKGAVRADYFWGFGNQAFAQASQMKEVAQMWLLLPKGQKTPANGSGPLTRGLGTQSGLAECVVPDPEQCTE